MSHGGRHDPGKTLRVHAGRHTPLWEMWRNHKCPCTLWQASARRGWGQRTGELRGSGQLSPPPKSQ